MATWVHFDISPTPLSSGLTKQIDEAFGEVGARVAPSGDVSFLARDVRGESERRCMPWHQLGTGILPTDLARVAFDLPFVEDDSYGFLLELWMADPETVQELVIVAPVDGFAREFSESDRDRARRLQHVSEALHRCLPAAVTGAYADHHDGEEAWFLFTGGERRWIQNLSLEACDLSSWSGPAHFMRWVAGAEVPVDYQVETEAGLLHAPSGPAALLRNCLVCGARLPTSPRDADYGRLSEAKASRYGRALWLLDDLAAVEKRFGPPDQRLPGMALDEADHNDGLSDVIGQLVYWHREPQVAVIVREYANRRLAVSFAGKLLR